LRRNCIMSAGVFYFEPPCSMVGRYFSIFRHLFLLSAVMCTNWIGNLQSCVEVAGYILYKVCMLYVFVICRLYENTVLPESHTKPYLIYAYSDFCFHCMQVAPIWDQIQEDLEKIGIFCLFVSVLFVLVWWCNLSLPYVWKTVMWLCHLFSMLNLSCMVPTSILGRYR